MRYVLPPGSGSAKIPVGVLAQSPGAVLGTLNLLYCSLGEQLATGCSRQFTDGFAAHAAGRNLYESRWLWAAQSA